MQPYPFPVLNAPPQVTLTLPIPPSMNNLFPSTLYRCKKTTKLKVRRFKSEAYQDWLVAAETELQIQRLTRPRDLWHIPGRFTVLCEYARFPDKRRRDLMNYEKATLDFLTAQKIIHDDCLAESGTFRWVDGLSPRTVRITVTPA